MCNTQSVGKIQNSTKYKSLFKINDILNCTFHYFDHQFDELLDNVMRMVTEAIRAEASSILILDDGDNTLFFQSATGKKASELKHFQIEMGRGIAGWVAETGAPLLVPDVSKDERWDPTIAQELQFKTVTIVCVPLVFDGKTIGVIEVLNCLDKISFDQEDLEYLVAIAEPVAAAIRSARLYSQVRKENKTLKNLLDLKQQIIGNSSTLSQVLNLVKKVSSTEVAVLIQGETGTGKELIAKTIHENSPRRDKPFIAVNCAAIPDTLIEEELFGHEKGSFTDAHETKQGKFELASGGTLFLDEVGDMSLSAQSKVLRVLQDNRILKIGGSDYIHVNVRIISATNRDLMNCTRSKQFREDLYYRLNEFSIKLPALRDRKEDIPELVNCFMESFNIELKKRVHGMTTDALKKLMSYNWPGNIRELRNFVRRVMILMEGDTIEAQDIQLSDDQESVAESQTEPIRLKDMEREHIIRVVKMAKTKSKAAQLLDISRPTLDKKIKEYSLEPAFEI